MLGKIKNMLGKINSVVKALKEHDSKLFQSDGLTLEREEFAHVYRHVE